MLYIWLKRGLKKGITKVMTQVQLEIVLKCVGSLYLTLLTDKSNISTIACIKYEAIKLYYPNRNNAFDQYEEDCNFHQVKKFLFHFFFLSGVSSQTLTIHRTAEEGRGASFIPLYHFYPLTNIETFICGFACEMIITFF